MQEKKLLVQWDYTYDKEGYWTDDDSGETRFPLKVGSYALPELEPKTFDILAVTEENGAVVAELLVDHSRVIVRSDGEPVRAYADHSYSVCGDCVDESLCMDISIV